MTKSRCFSGVWLLLALGAVGCADGAARLSPLGPTPLASVETAPSANDWAADHGWSAAATGRVAVADGVVVQAVEVIGAVSGTCPSRTIHVRGVAVAVTSATALVAPTTCAALSPGMTVHITGVLSASGAGYSVTATQVAAMGGATDAPAADSGTGERVNGEGVIGAVSGACPSLMLTIHGHQVHTGAVTSYRAGSCETLRAGTSVRLTVEKQRDGRMLVESLEFLR